MLLGIILMKPRFYASLTLLARAIKLSLLFPRMLTIQGKETNSLYAFKVCVQLHQYFLNILKRWVILNDFPFQNVPSFLPITANH